MSYPKHMYKGSYTSEAIQAGERIVVDEKDEKAARKAGFIDGHEFFSKPPSSKRDEGIAVMKQLHAEPGKIEAPAK